MASKDTDTGLACFGLIAFLPMLFITMCLLSGWVGASLWTWFIVPLFHVQPLLWWQAVGLAMTIGFFTHQEQPTIKDDDRSAWVKISTTLFRYPMGYMFAYVFHYFWH